MSEFVFRWIAKAHVRLTNRFSSDPYKVKIKSTVGFYQRWKQSHNDERLIFATNAGLAATVFKLLKRDKDGNRKANPNVVSDTGITPLLLAIDRCHVHIVKLLLELEASPFEQEVKIPIWDDNQDRVTKDPLERAILRGLSAEGVFEIARRRPDDSNHVIERIQSMIDLGVYHVSPVTGVIVSLMLRHRDELPPPPVPIVVQVESKDESTCKEGQEIPSWGDEQAVGSVS